MHLIDYVNLIMLLCLMKQVRLDLSGHMGGNEKIIKCLSVCLYFLPIGDCIVPFHFSFKVVFFFRPNCNGGHEKAIEPDCPCVLILHVYR